MTRTVAILGSVLGTAGVIGTLSGGVAVATESASALTLPRHTTVADPAGDVEGEDGTEATQDATDVTEVRYAAVRDDKVDKAGYSVRFSVLHGSTLEDGQHRAVTRFVVNDDDYRMVFTATKAALFVAEGEGEWAKIAVTAVTRSRDGRLSVTFEKPRGWSEISDMKTRLRVDETDLVDKTTTAESGIRLYPNR